MEIVEGKGRTDKSEKESFSGLNKAQRVRGKRPRIEIIEKQALEMQENSGKKSSGLTRDNTSGKEAQIPKKREPNKAAAGEEFTVVRDEKNGEVITSERVLSQVENQMLHGIPEIMYEEHHSDPPLNDREIDLNFTVNENNLYEDEDMHENELCGVMSLDMIF